MKLTCQVPHRCMSLLIQLRTRHVPLMQLRTGHVPLKKHLVKVGKASSPTCPACSRYNETVHHFLFRCQAYKEERKQLEQSLKRHGRSVKTLLANPKVLPALFKYIGDMGQFKNTKEGAEAAGGKE